MSPVVWTRKEQQLRELDAQIDRIDQQIDDVYAAHPWDPGIRGWPRLAWLEIQRLQDLRDALGEQREAFAQVKEEDA